MHKPLQLEVKVTNRCTITIAAKYTSMTVCCVPQYWSIIMLPDGLHNMRRKR